MSGARLESAGQVREAYPYIVSAGVKTSIVLTAANAFQATAQVLRNNIYIPFDKGPDKSSRVFITVHSAFINAYSDAGTTTKLKGVAYLMGLDGKKMYLTSFNTLLDAVGASARESAFKGTLFAPMATDESASLATAGFEDGGSAIGTASIITLDLYLNIGLYGDYAEPDWINLFQIPQHQHVAMDDFDINT